MDHPAGFRLPLLGLPDELKHDDSEADPCASLASPAQWDSLPPRAMRLVLAHLDPAELVMSAAVCRSWREASDDPGLWLAHWRSPLLPALHQVECVAPEDAKAPVVAALQHSFRLFKAQQEFDRQQTFRLTYERWGGLSSWLQTFLLGSCFAPFFWWPFVIGCLVLMVTFTQGSPLTIFHFLPFLWAISLLYSSCLCSQCPRYQRLKVLNKLRVAHYRGSDSCCEPCPTLGYLCTGYTDLRPEVKAQCAVSSALWFAPLDGPTWRVALLHTVTTLGFTSLVIMMSWWASQPSSGAAMVAAMSAMAVAVAVTLAFLVWQDASKTERLSQLKFRFKFFFLVSVMITLVAAGLRLNGDIEQWWMAMLPLWGFLGGVALLLAVLSFAEADSPFRPVYFMLIGVCAGLALPTVLIALHYDLAEGHELVPYWAMGIPVLAAGGAWATLRSFSSYRQARQLLAQKFMGRLGLSSCACKVPTWVRYIRVPSLFPTALLPSLETLQRHAEAQNTQLACFRPAPPPSQNLPYAATSGGRRPPRQAALSASSAAQEDDNEGMADEAFLFGSDYEVMV